MEVMTYVFTHLKFVPTRINHILQVASVGSSSYGDVPHDFRFNRQDSAPLRRNGLRAGYSTDLSTDE